MNTRESLAKSRHIRLLVELESTGIAERTKRQEEFHRLARLGNQEMEAQTIEITLFVGKSASSIFSLMGFQAWNAVDVADSNRKTINHIHRAFVQVLIKGRNC